MLTHTTRHPARPQARLIFSDVSVPLGATPALSQVDVSVTSGSRAATRTAHDVPRDATGVNGVPARPQLHLTTRAEGEVRA